MKHFANLGLLLLLIATGCGGGEDFSKPPPGIARLRSKSKAKSRSETQPAVPDSNAGNKAAGDTGVGTPDPGTAVSSSPSTLQMIAAEGNQGTQPVGQATPGNLSEIANSNSDEPAKGTLAEGQSDAVAAASVQGEGGDKIKDASNEVPKVASKDEEKKAKGEETGKTGMSFLDALKSDSDSKTGRGGRPGRERNIVQRTGRLAVPIQTWLQLKLAMSKKFFVATTSDAARIAVSSGERQLGVLSTHVERRMTQVGQQLSGRAAMLAARRPSATSDLQSITALPAVINSIELADNGQIVLIGTEDGRLLARSCADLMNWDLYSQDLFAFQDEHRPGARISETGVVLVRQIDAAHLITVDGNGVCRVWKTDEIVHAPIPPLEMTTEQVVSGELKTLTATPVSEVRLPKSQLMSLTMSSSAKFCAIVTASEEITVFQPADGHTVASLGAEELDDTQPVVVCFQEDRGQILIGLADGRILRKALPGGTAVSSIDDAGVEVDYEVVFAPVRTDRGGPVTAMELSEDSSLLYFGRYDGTVSKFDLPRKQMVVSRKTHGKPVVEVKVTSHGVLTVGDDRTAQLSEMPLPATQPSAPTGRRGLATTAAATTQKFTLPRDASLPVQANREAEAEDNGATKSTRPRNLAAAATIEPAASALVGIRPADPRMALMKHQLRVCNDERIVSLREEIAKARLHQPVSTAGDEATPGLLGELQTLIDYSAKVITPVVMNVSNDGHIVVLANSAATSTRTRSLAGEVIAWDVSTQTVLRTWRGLESIDGLEASWENSIVMPRPLTARLNLLSGQSVFDPLVRFGQFAWSYDRKNVLVEQRGISGQAQNVVSLQSATGEVLTSGVEAFEGVVGAMAYSSDGATVFVSLREKSRIRLLELDRQNLEVVTELSNEPVHGAWSVERVDAKTVVGPTLILPSPNGRLLVTYGRYEKEYQLRVWKKSGRNWPQDQVAVMPARTPMVDALAADSPIVFVNQKDNMLGVIGTEGLVTIDSRTGEVKDTLAIPDVGGRRPVIAFTRDGQFALSGDSEGHVWVSELRALDRRPRKFVAQAGAITGLRLSQDGTKLVTAGQENRIRVWDLESFLYPEPDAVTAN